MRGVTGESGIAVTESPTVRGYKRTCRRNGAIRKSDWQVGAKAGSRNKIGHRCRADVYGLKGSVPRAAKTVRGIKCYSVRTSGKRSLKTAARCVDRAATVTLVGVQIETETPAKPHGSGGEVLQRNR